VFNILDEGDEFVDCEAPGSSVFHVSVCGSVESALKDVSRAIFGEFVRESFRSTTVGDSDLSSSSSLSSLNFIASPRRDS
jgi:hypothetical protein